MKITLKNTELPTAIQFLKDLNLKGSDSRCRSKLVKLLEVPMQEFAQDEAELLKEYDLLDEQGQIKQDGEQEKVRQFKVEQNKLYQEQVIIDSGTYTPQIEKLKDILENIKIELSGDNAEIYDRLLDEMEGE